MTWRITEDQPRSAKLSSLRYGGREELQAAEPGGSEPSRSGPEVSGRHAMSDRDPAADEPGSAGTSARPALAAKALSEPFGRLRYRDTSLLIWQQQQMEVRSGPPATYLNRSQSAWYSSYGNQAVLIRNRRGQPGSEGQSRICSIM